MATNKLDLHKKLWHRLFLVLFVLSVFAALIVIVINAYSWSIIFGSYAVFFHEFWPPLLWLLILSILVNIVYFEGVIYIITGKHGNSFYRWLLKKYHQLLKKI